VTRTSRPLPGPEAPRHRFNSHSDPELNRPPFVARLVSFGRMTVSLGRHRRPRRDISRPPGLLSDNHRPASLLRFATFTVVRRRQARPRLFWHGRCICAVKVLRHHGGGMPGAAKRLSGGFEIRPEPTSSPWDEKETSMLNPASRDQGTGRPDGGRQGWPAESVESLGQTPGGRREAASPQNQRPEDSTREAVSVRERPYWLVPTDRSDALY